MVKIVKTCISLDVTTLPSSLAFSILRDVGSWVFLEPDLDFLPFYFFPTNRTSTDSSAFFVKSANALPIVLDDK